MTKERAAEICQYIKFILKNEDYTEEVEEALDVAIKALEQEPSCRKFRQVDLISREQAIKEISDEFENEWEEADVNFNHGLNMALSIIKALSVLDQDEIIYCKDCKFKRGLGYEGHYYCALEDRPNRNWSVDETDFCSWGERESDKE